MSNKIQGTKLLRRHKELLQKRGYDWHDWLFVFETEFYLKVIRRDNGYVKMISKY